MVVAQTSPLPNRNLQPWLIGGTLGLLFLFALRALLLPDPTSSLFFRAQRLETQGRLEMALRHYAMLVELHPESSYAPTALQHEGDILTNLAQHARHGEDVKYYSQAVASYLRLADTYISSPLAGAALLSVGELASNNLHDTKTAKQAYDTLLERFPNNMDYVSEATLRLGRLAITTGDAKTAQTLLQNVLQHYTNYPDRCAEAQYNLGVTYETLFKNKPWAKNAYLATCTHYPQSVWASTARERLGMLFYHETAPIMRRVQIEVTPLPDEGIANGSLFAALRPLLAARKLEVSDISLRGWSLEPFFSGFDPGDPSRVVQPPFDGFDNAVANVGLRYTKFNERDDTAALQALQSELDAARPPVVFNGRWALAVGYDTARNEVLIQNHGAQFDTVAKKDFALSWKQPSPFGGNHTMLAFYMPGERATFAKPQPPAITAGGNLPQATPAAGGKPSVPTASTTPEAPNLSTPTFIYSLKPLTANAAHRRTLRRAVALMRRPQDGDALLNLEALRALSEELTRVTITSPAIPVASKAASPVPQPETATPQGELPATDNADPDATPATARASATVVPTPTVAPQAPPTQAPLDAAERTRTLLVWFKGPLQHWIKTRRDAAAYLDAASNALHEATLKLAADNFRKSINELQNAAAALPAANDLSADGTTLHENARRRLQIASRYVDAARNYESRAVDEMSEVAR